MLSKRDDDESTPNVKVVLLGDSDVGKTALIYSYTTNVFYDNVPKTWMDSYEVTVNVKQKETKLGICDTAGQQDFDKLRQLVYPGSDVFIICFSLVDRSSFHHVNKWVEELKMWELDAPIILVATKKDLRDSQSDADLRNTYTNQSFVSPTEGKRLSQQIHAVDYIETSACTQDGIKNVFDTVIMIKFNGVNFEKRKKKCTLL